MNRSALRPVVLFIVLLAALPALAQPRHALTFDDLMKIQRIADPQVSPDGQWIAYVVSTPDLDGNKMVSHIWRLPLAGGEPRQLTRGDAPDSRPRWSPDSKSIAFMSSRGGGSQVWIIPADGGEARQLTDLATEADGVTWAAKADALLFTSEVYPDCSGEACNKKRLDEEKSSKVKARVIDRLFFRHWDHWLEGKVTHLFAVSPDGGEPRDLTSGPYTSPTFFLGAPDGYAFSPDGKEVCYTSNHSQPPSSVAWTTNNDLYLVSATGGEAKNITAANPGSDAAPQYSPNGRYIAYTSQATDGYESSLFRLRVYDRETGQIKDLTTGFDQWVLSFTWAPDSDTLYFIAPEGIEQPIFKTSISHPRVTKVLDGYNGELSVAPGGRLVFTHQSLTQPPEIYTASTSGGPLTQLTHMNEAVMAGIEMNPAESVKTPGALGAQIESILVKPPNFDANMKYPGLMLIHGGPQGAWNDSWFYRWNAELFASFGYVVMATNFHGSIGYGQPFTAEISGDWGGAPYEDLMKATDSLEKLPYVDKDHIGAAGASYGGYMIDWIEGHTDRFKVLVSHDGVFDLRSMYGETEELWFPEWELKGIPWKNPAPYEKWSPSHYIQNAKTPMLIFQGNRDYRVPEGQSFQLFTTLQRQGVPSKLVYLEQESHLVLKPLDSRFWYTTVQNWLAKYLKK
ncbi:MAG TPA: S9 family peptidase [Terriglobia bacterium]|nr:S9 family peptidase [Terriglobia bacterium]